LILLFDQQLSNRQWAGKYIMVESYQIKHRRDSYTLFEVNELQRGIFKVAKHRDGGLQVIARLRRDTQLVTLYVSLDRFRPIFTNQLGNFLCGWLIDTFFNGRRDFVLLALCYRLCCV